jgi:hypothetical protein
VAEQQKSAVRISARFRIRNAYVHDVAPPIALPLYEPGCGDARITIAAVKSGPSQGVGIDIDRRGSAESRARVKEADLENKVEIRLGDALDIQDLSTATVVFLCTWATTFNLLIRPILWKQFKVGARVVSHRFTMGDWKPGKTVSVTSEFGGEYELHLW